MSRLTRRIGPAPHTILTALLAVVLFIAANAAAFAAEPTPKAIDSAALFNFPKDPHSGFSLAIVHNGRLSYEKGFGFRDDGTPDRYIPDDHNYYGLPVKRGVASRAPADGRTIYEIGSVTKQFTAAAILMLVEQHQLGLDDAVSRYAPEFRDPGLTVRVLLTQRSGLPDFNALAFVERVRPLAKRPDGSIDDLRVSREIAAQTPHFAPGVKFEYSNSNYLVLGTIVERITRQPLGRFLSTKVFSPLGMTRTAYADWAAQDDRAIGYRLDTKHNVLRAYPFDLAWLGGSGAMTSTVEDLARWDIALVSHRILQPSSLREMWHGVDSGRGQGMYAMGWVEDALGSHRYLWHNGETGGYHALNVIFPNDGLALSMLSNNQDARPEYLLPSIAALYFPVSGLDRVLPHSAIVLIEASLAVALGALAIAVVAVVTVKRLIVAGVIAAFLALVIGFFVPSYLGYVWGGLAALLPVAAYLLLVRFVSRKRRAQA